MLTTLKWVAVAAGIKGVCQLWYYYNLMITDRAVQDLRNAYSTGPKLITNGPHSVQILDESGFASGARVPPPTQKRAPSTTIRILSVTSRSATAWVKEENRDGLYAVERASGKVHLFIQPRWRLSPSIGPACTQLEAFLRLHKIPYTVHVVNVLCAQGSEQAARVEDIPQESQSAGQRELGEEERQRRAALSSHRSLPFVVYKGEVVMGTFDVLTRYLEKKFNLPPPSYHADKEACAVAQALSRTLEFSLHMEYSVGMLLDSPSLFSKYAAGAMGVPGWVMRVWVGIPFLSGLVSDVRRSLKVHDLGYLTKSQLDASFFSRSSPWRVCWRLGRGLSSLARPQTRRTVFCTLT
ncbi:hypothetical protein AGDE_14371 [Angomonas deanei]|uniref:Thioredoxin-like fold domain-containing protein n=1 Tax=Angomonas deanei TaxID=59799 RepID=A0A7G2CLL2_9TRYP|nr:hypothetical protein AGDE_14371 [Angomonas deanei]CAD2219801.1 hypothetical protein, conserved [Angomonas deanei]|eukprot:EPY20959.1 hypothetical protein AGDE_14371 [Angomonas deanei]